MIEFIIVQYEAYAWHIMNCKLNLRNRPDSIIPLSRCNLPRDEKISHLPARIALPYLSCETQRARVLTIEPRLEDYAGQCRCKARSHVSVDRYRAAPPAIPALTSRRRNHPLSEKLSAFGGTPSGMRGETIYDRQKIINNK